MEVVPSLHIQGGLVQGWQNGRPEENDRHAVMPLCRYAGMPVAV